MSTAPPPKPLVQSTTTQLPAVSGTRSIASIAPMGWNLPGVHPWRSLWATMTDNLDALGAAWSILAHGVCDHSSLGVAGLHDGLPGGFHVDEHRRRHIRLHTQPPIAPADLLDLPRLRAMSPEAMGRLGRLSAPYIHRAGERGFTKVSWDQAFRALKTALPKPRGTRMAFLAGAEGLSIEAAYAFSKTARLLTCPHIDLVSADAHADIPSTLQETLGVRRATGSLEDILHSELVLVLGTQLATTESRARSLLLAAKRRGARIVVVNPIREPALAQVRTQSDLRAALFGLRLADDFVEVAVGGDAAFFTGVAKAIVERTGWNPRFVADRTIGLEALTDALEAHRWEDLQLAAGCARRDMEWVAELAVRADRGFTLIGTGLARHPNAPDATRAIVNVHLLRGWVGTDGTGILPLDSTIGRPGARLAGVHPAFLPGEQPIGPGTAATLSGHWSGHFVPVKPGRSVAELAPMAAAGELDLLVCMAAHLCRDLRQSDAFGKIGVRVFLDATIRPSMALDGAELTVLLPIDGFYAQEGGATALTADARVRFSPEIVPTLRLARAPWQALAGVAETLDPDIVPALTWDSAVPIRAEIARVIPQLSRIAALAFPGEWIQPDGRHAGLEERFPTDSGRAALRSVPFEPRVQMQAVPRRAPPLDSADRHQVLVSVADARQEGIQDGDFVTVTTEHGQYRGRTRVVVMPAGAVHVCVPEAAVLFGNVPGRTPVTAALQRSH